MSKTAAVTLVVVLMVLCGTMCSAARYRASDTYRMSQGRVNMQQPPEMCMLQ